MILILGSTHDDILYFESVMTDRKEEDVFGLYKIQIGKIFSQEVILASDIYTSYETSILTHYLIEKYYVILVFVVGKCVSFNDDFKSGEIAIAKRVFLGDVDQIREYNSALGQIPHFPAYFQTEDEITSIIQRGLETRTFTKYHQATFISANAIFDTHNKIQGILADGQIFGKSDHIVFDCISGGVAIACNLTKVTFAVAKVIERKLDNAPNVNYYINVLNEYSNIGKAIVSCIGEIGRNEILKGGE